MPGDLLNYVFGPQAYSSRWLWLAVGLLVVVIVWNAGVVVWTLPSHRLRQIPVVRQLHSRLLRLRFARRVQRIADEHRSGAVDAPSACAAIGRTVRSFVHQATGTRAQYLQVNVIADSQLATAAPVLTDLADVQFNPETQLDIDDVTARARELIRSWP